MVLFCSYDSIIHVRASPSYATYSKSSFANHLLPVPWQTLLLVPGDPTSPCDLPALPALHFIWPRNSSLQLKLCSSNGIPVPHSLEISVSLSCCYHYIRRQVQVDKLVAKQKGSGVGYGSFPKSWVPSYLASVRESISVLSCTRK